MPNLMYRNFHFFNADYRVAWIIPFLGGVRGVSLGCEISMNIKRITDLPTPKSPPKRGISTFHITLRDKKGLYSRFFLNIGRTVHKN